MKSLMQISLPRLVAALEEGKQVWLVIHTHESGADSRLVVAEEAPPCEPDYGAVEFAKSLGLCFEPDKGEELHVAALFAHHIYECSKTPK